MEKETYQNPLIERYASDEMVAVFSPQFKFSTWRKLWIALAEAEKELGLTITDDQIEQMKRHQDSIDFDEVARIEKDIRHDVVAHIRAFAKQCPQAAGIIHLGTTSAFVGDNTDLIQMREALGYVKVKLLNVMQKLAEFALRYKDLPTLAYTHFQPAQLTTVGKRAALWLQDLLMDYTEIAEKEKVIYFRGAKGTTGTQASFLKLFNGDHDKVKKLDKLVAGKMGFDTTFPITSQTYPRKLDYKILQILSGIAQSAHKFANDIRLLMRLREMEEPFTSAQVGSSAMPYKRNPIRSERMTALARYVISLVINTAMTASEQWFERTLDDSANRRITIPEAFLATDSILNIFLNIAGGLKVNEPVVKRNLELELPFIASENIMMEAVQAGGNRQVLHEKIRSLALEAYESIKIGGPNDLIERMENEPLFKDVDITTFIDPTRYTGRSAQQVEEFIAGYIKPVLDANKNSLGMASELAV